MHVWYKLEFWSALDHDWTGASAGPSVSKQTDILITTTTLKIEYVSNVDSLTFFSSWDEYLVRGHSITTLKRRGRYVVSRKYTLGHLKKNMKMSLSVSSSGVGGQNLVCFGSIICWMPLLSVKPLSHSNSTLFSYPSCATIFITDSCLHYAKAWLTFI